MTVRTSILFSVVLSVSLLAAGCGGSGDSANEHRLVVYTAAVADTMEPKVELFKKWAKEINDYYEMFKKSSWPTEINTIKDLQQILTPAEDGFEIGIDRVFECINKLDESQKYYPTTRCSHAALILGDQLKLVSFAEDVGRHNSLDKAIGKAFMDRKLSKARVAVLSSRNSYELVQKAARARLPVMISVSRTTALAVEMGKALNMTLAFPGKSELVIVCGEHRIKRA